ncbi:MAG: META domain-containing protein [Pseudomonadales bacterium]|nr:META domain-containing protein [Pseudomonadales bacterium]MBO6564335.1 META domain-containing protein [Pseudomonadales bacterium]MBO6596394.1 META domain-containing protein [Pseudomonadales bacterium]MBO6822874.1 META domain-containing protein [Pseudomonadales bacterium]
MKILKATLPTGPKRSKGATAMSMFHLFTQLSDVLFRLVTFPKDPRLTPFSLALAMSLTALGGCSTTPEASELAGIEKLSEGQIWRVEDIENRGIIDRSRITVKFERDSGQISGSSGCNRFFGNYSFTKSRLNIEALASSRRLCVPALMNQEQRLLTALESVTEARWRESTWLELYDSKGTYKLRLIQEGVEENKETRLYYQCDEKLTPFVVLPGDEKLLLTVEDRQWRLNRQESASGARYVGEGIEFWIKGKEALMTMAGRSVNCMQKKDLLVVGGDRDEHGCIGSAGYQWCRKLDQCVRGWELAGEHGLQDPAEAIAKICD